MIKKDLFAAFKILYEKQYKAPNLFVPCPLLIVYHVWPFFFSSSRLVQMIRVDFVKL